MGERWGSAPRNGVWPTHKTSPSHECYHVESGRSAPKGVSINRGELQQLGSAGTPPVWMGTVDSLEIRPSRAFIPCRVCSL